MLGAMEQPAGFRPSAVQTLLVPSVGFEVVLTVRVLGVNKVST